MPSEYSDENNNVAPCILVYSTITLRISATKLVIAIRTNDLG